MKKVLVLLLLMVSTNIFANESYLCIADKATGFSFNKQSKTYESGNFNVSKSKYILKNNNNTWEWTDFGRKYSLCKGSFNASGIFGCGGGVEEVTFNKNNLRYVKTSIFGYLAGGDKNSKIKDGENDLYIEIGECSPM